MKTSERRENLFNHWAALCENENAQTRIPRSWNEVMGTPEGWKEIFNRPVAEAIRQLGGGLATEIPLPLNEFKRHVDGVRFQLIENWCLCKYCQLYGSTANCRKSVLVHRGDPA